MLHNRSKVWEKTPNNAAMHWPLHANLVEVIAAHEDDGRAVGEALGGRPVAHLAQQAVRRSDLHGQEEQESHLKACMHVQRCLPPVLSDARHVGDTPLKFGN